MTNKNSITIVKIDGAYCPFKVGQKLRPGAINEKASTITSWGLACKEASIWDNQKVSPQQTIILEETEK